MNKRDKIPGKIRNSSKEKHLLVRYDNVRDCRIDFYHDRSFKIRRYGSKRWYWHEWYMKENKMYCDTIKPTHVPFIKSICEAMLEQIADYELLGGVEPLYVE